ncbi:hypothetical protein [Endomicrobium proavitum]|uniref:Uncharacterized protein n=1 Tax=Endomicrobium proavitum TaxID=1408281 RepID=A0A0G3WJX5_9BACT|nr:hypothetical protein [Endomicrobium proavitum]AKL98195.1 hypothetical protein Epro_0816 [Endomicrobium proavitum]
MITKEIFTAAAKDILSDNLFVIDEKKSVFYDEVSFGSSYIYVLSREEIAVMFMNERGDVAWCQIGYKKPNYFIEDVFKYLNIPNVKKTDDFLEMVQISSEAIAKNKDKIFEAFNTSNREITISKLNEIVEMNKKQMIEKFSKK